MTSDSKSLFIDLTFPFRRNELVFMNVFINTLIWCSVEVNLQIIFIYNVLVKGRSHLNICELNSLHRELHQKPCFKNPSNMLQVWMGSLTSQPQGAPHFTTSNL